MQIVGVAKLSNYRTKLETPKPFFYVPLRQNFSVQCGLVIKTHQSTSAVAGMLADEVHRIDQNLAPQDTITMKEQVDRMTYTERLAVALLAVFGGMALLLAAIGLYAVMSYAVSQSTRELGLRMALGAVGSDLMRLVMSRGLILTAGGLVVGLIAALSLTQLMGTLLYQVSPRDPVAFSLAFAVLIAVAAFACFLPAWRAMRIDPARALRT
jgi:ABC-type antimicrobial peptide transport system permease subunit